MKLLLAFVVAILAVISQSQTVSQDPPDLIVLKFSCGNYEQRSSMIRSVQDPGPAMNEPIRINQTTRNEPQEIKNRRDMQERRAEMKAAEINASLSNQPESRVYFYRLRFKNTGTKVVKSLAWEYHPAGAADPTDRQFFCAIKTKPNETKELELFSPLAPFRVVDASTAGDKPAKGSEAEISINKIEYADGSVWQRPGWNAKIFSAEAAQKVESGKCIGL